MATDPARITTPERTAEDADAALRPKTLDEFIGQKAARENLRVFVSAAKGRGEALDHVLLHGPPGLGKTTLAGIVIIRTFLSFSLEVEIEGRWPWDRKKGEQRQV